MPRSVRRGAGAAIVVTAACALALGAVPAGAQPNAPASSSSGVKSGVDLIAPAPGGRVRVIDADIQGADTVSARFRLDTGVVALAPLPPCGQRPCTPGAALRAARVAPPAARVPTNATVPVALEFENRGRVATAPVDVRLDLTNPLGPESRDVFTLRALRPGERVRVVRAFHTPRAGGANRLAAWVDGRPEFGTAPGVLAPGAVLGQSEAFQFEGPVLQWARVDVSGQVPVGAPVRIGFVVRNPSVAATAPATEVQIQASGFYGGVARPDPAGYRFTLPPLPPGAVLSATVEALGLTAGGGYFDAALAADPDRAHRQEWGSVAVYYPTQSTRVRVGAGR